MEKIHGSLDLNAPRFRPNRVGTMNAEFEKILYTKYPKLKKYDKTKIREIVGAFNNKIFDAVINNRDGVELPESIGKIFIGTFPKKKYKCVDFKKTREMGRTVQFNNMETDGHLGKIVFSRYGIKFNFQNADLWTFDACKDFKKLVGEKYKENWKRYVEVVSGEKLGKQIKTKFAYEKKNEIKEQQLKTYNEFEL